MKKQAVLMTNRRIRDHRISNLSVKGENGRFYVIECVYEFYVDKYTDDIFVHYRRHG